MSSTAAARTVHAQADAEGVARVAHKLKGEAATVGLREIHALAVRLQDEGQRGDLRGAAVTLDALAAAWQRAEAALDHLLVSQVASEA